MPNPFLKWAGGKRWLVSAELFSAPAYNRYVEPFLGSAAVFFHLQPERAILSDVNEDLIALYKIIRDKPVELYKVMQEHQRNHRKTYYYKMRSHQPRTELRRAARFLYLNRTCWNGLYRVNLSGEFNVPIGTKSTVIFDTDDFVTISSALKNADIRCADFEVIIDECERGDFLFVDPPYTVQHNFNNFIKYNEKIFSWEDQIRLRDSLQRAAERGVAIISTNADHESVRQIYGGIAQYKQIHRHSVLAADSNRRGATTEALFLMNVP